MWKRKIIITEEDVERANETLMKMTEDEISEISKTPGYVHFTEDDFRKAGAFALKKVRRQEKYEKLWKRLLNIFN